MYSIVDYILQVCTDQGSSFLYKPKLPDGKSVTAMPNYVRIQSFLFKYQIQRDGNTESSWRQLNRSVTSCRTEAVKKLLLTADSLPFFLSLSLSSSQAEKKLSWEKSRNSDLVNKAKMTHTNASCTVIGVERSQLICTVKYNMGRAACPLNSSQRWAGASLARQLYYNITRSRRKTGKTCDKYGDDNLDNPRKVFKSFQYLKKLCKIILYNS